MRRVSRLRVTYPPLPIPTIPAGGTSKMATLVQTLAQMSGSINQARLPSQGVSAPFTQKAIVLDTLMVLIIPCTVIVQRPIVLLLTWVLGDL